jgi:hypothetical protein
VADLEDAMATNKEALDESIEQLQMTDTLHEGVMIRNFSMIADSANAAIEMLRSDGGGAVDGEPIAIGEPIVIVAPDTTATTNAPTR